MESAKDESLVGGGRMRKEREGDEEGEGSKLKRGKGKEGVEEGKEQCKVGDLHVLNKEGERSTMVPIFGSGNVGQGISK